MPAAILGDRACGKTTFLALLYASQVKYTNEPANKEKFKFFANPATVNFMGDMFNQLKIGGWPDSTAKGQRTRVEFLFGFKRLAGGLIPGWIEDKGWISPYNTIQFSVYDVAGEDVNDLVRTPDGVFSDDISDEIKDLLESRVLVILLDASRISAKPRSRPFMEMMDYDTKTATLISLIAEYNSMKKDVNQRRIYPVFVLTKFDIVPKKILREMKLTEDYPEMKEQKDRKVYAESILRNFFGQTLALIKGGQLKNVSFDEAGYFFSEVFSEFNDDGIPVPKLKSMEGGPGYEIDYSYPEYRGFIDHFKKITNKMPDAIKDAQDFSKK
jgi:hypothetical protein